MDSCLVIPAKTKSNQFNLINTSFKVYIVKVKSFDTTFISLNDKNV